MRLCKHDLAAQVDCLLGPGECVTGTRIHVSNGDVYIQRPVLPLLRRSDVGWARVVWNRMIGLRTPRGQVRSVDSAVLSVAGP
jgi:hypothetical protein